jgi:two-component system, NarL family, invasion response regulator UvrY
MTSSGHQEKLTVLLVDDHAVVREGYRRLLEEGGQITVIGESDTAEAALQQLERLNPDVVVMDIALPGISGIEALRRMRQSRPISRVLMFSMYEEAIYADRSMRAGASGYVTKASAPNVLVEAVHAVAAGGKYLSPDIAQVLAMQQVSKHDPLGDLSTREFEILRFLVEGLPVKDIAERMNLNPKTVANHQSIIRQKLGAESAVQLARLGAEILQDPRNAARYSD